MNKHRNSYVLFSLSLFLLFVIGSFFIVTYEIKGYQVIEDTCNNNDNLAVPLAYLNTRLKANDHDGCSEVVEIEGIKCLKITTEQTVTYIYYSDGYLKELYFSSDYMPSLDEGSKLFRLDGFEIEQEQQLFKFTVTIGKQSKMLAIYLHG